MFHYIKYITIGFTVFLLAACKNTTQPPDSNSGEQTTSTITPDTVDYTPVAGEWEGRGAYMASDLYESDSLFITHLELVKKAIRGDSVGYMAWNNKTEYRDGGVEALPAEGKNKYKINVISGNYTLYLTHHEANGEEWIEWRGGWISNGKLYRK